VSVDAVLCADEDLKRFGQVFVELLPMGVRLLEHPHTLGGVGCPTRRQSNPAVIS